MEDAIACISYPPHHEQFVVIRVADTDDFGLHANFFEPAAFVAADGGVIARDDGQPHDS
jgi:hypothetical protein